jgi:hypothetical protein
MRRGFDSIEPTRIRPLFFFEGLRHAGDQFRVRPLSGSLRRRHPLAKPPTPPYPRERERERWPLNPVPPVRDLRQARDLLADAKRIIAERRASRLLHELGG